MDERPRFVLGLRRTGSEVGVRGMVGAAGEMDAVLREAFADFLLRE